MSEGTDVWSRFEKVHKKPWLYIVERSDLVWGLAERAQEAGWYPMGITDEDTNDDFMPMVYRCHAVLLGEHPTEAQVTSVLSFVNAISNRFHSNDLKIAVYNYPELPTADDFWEGR